MGKKAVDLGLITAQQLQEVLAQLSDAGPASAGKHPSIADALITRGLLTKRQAEVLSGSSGPLEQLGKYRILRELGRGGMGLVVEAEDEELGRRVALKMLLASPGADGRENALEEERFIREARLSANLPKHPNIVGVYEAGVIDGRRFIAMELIEGAQFSEWRRKGSITMRQQVAVLRDTALAVDHAHRHRIIHRDLKPANLLIDARNHPHITDFGLAKRPSQDTLLSLTASGMVMGTPAFMSPEQAEGRKDIDRRSDIWSLGVMLYEVLTGKLPFEGATAVEILVKTVRDPVPTPTSLFRGPRPASLDPAIENICLKALEKDRANRFQTAKVFADDLTRWLKGEKVEAQAPVRKRGRAPLYGGLAAAALLILSIAALLLFRGPSAEEIAQDKADRARPLVAEGRKLLGQGKVSEALDAFNTAAALDPGNAGAVAGRRDAQKRLQSQDLGGSLASLDAAVSALRNAENFGAARDLLEKSRAQSASPDWTSAVETRLAALSGQAKALHAELFAAAAAAKRRGDAEALEAARSRVIRWRWPELLDQFNREIASAPSPEPKPKAVLPAPPPAPPQEPPKEAAPRPLPSWIRALPPITGHLNGVTRMAFSPDGKSMVSTSYDQTVRLFDLAEGKERMKLWSELARSVAWTRDGKRLAAGGYSGDVKLWDAATLQEQTLSGQKTQILGLQFSADGRTLYSGSTDGTVRFYDVSTGAIRQTLEGNTKGVLDLAISPDDRRIAAACASGEIRIFELPSGRLVRTLNVLPERGDAVAFLRDSKRLLVAGNGGQLFVCDLEGDKSVPLPGHDKRIGGVAVSDNGRWMASVSDHGPLIVWDAATLKPVWDVQAAGGGCFGVQFVPGTSIVVGAGYNWVIHRWDLREGPPK